MDSSHGCNMSLASDDVHCTNLQPHEIVSNNDNNKHEKHHLTTIYTQNAHGLWHCPRDADGNILVDKPPDLSKLEYLIDYMRQNDVGVWLVQETWEEGGKFDVNVNGYHIFRHNANCGENGYQHLFRGVAIILSPLFYDAWKAVGSPPPITTNPNDDFVGRFMLMDLCSKIFSSVMNGRAFKLLDAHGTHFQFGGTPELGCRDGLFVLKTLLTMQKNHNLSSHVAFVDLVKAYDTANHVLLLDILEQYSAPPRFVAAIDRTYRDLVVVLKIEKEVVELPQTVGVRQGDNMAPVLFLFLMSVVEETLKAE